MAYRGTLIAILALAAPACGGDDDSEPEGPVLLAEPQGTGSAFGNGFLALGPDHVFFGYKGTPAGGLARVNKDGTGVMCIVCDEGEPRGIAVGSASVYWADTTLGELRRAPQTGGPAATLWSGTVGTPVAIDTTGIYWFDSGGQRVMRADQSGQNATQVEGNQRDVSSIEADAGFLFWTNRNQILAKDLGSASAPLALAAARVSPRSVAVDDSDVYWIEGTWDQPDNVVVSVPRTGGSIAHVTTAGQASVFAIALDATHVYAADNFGGTIWRVPKTGGEIEVLAQDQPYPFDIEVDDEAVYWASETTGELSKVAK